MHWWRNNKSFKKQKQKKQWISMGIKTDFDVECQICLLVN